MDFVQDRQAQDTVSPAAMVAVVAGFAASIALVWFVSGELALTATYGGGIMSMGVLLGLLVRRKPGVKEEAAVIPDWSVTGAAMDHPEQAIAIVDRAGRLVCANSLYQQQFSATHAPQGLSLAQEPSDILLRAARAALRDGEALAERFEHNGQLYRLELQRTGLAEDYLIWRFRHQAGNAGLDNVEQLVLGPMGRILSFAGIEMAVVGPDGVVIAAGPGLARHALGDENAALAGQQFASLLRTDEQDRIFFAREGRKGNPQTLVQVPLSDPAAALNEGAPQPDSLMLLLEAGVGIGGWGGDVKAGTPQLESLLGQLPLGLAMTDRDGHFLFANAAFKRAAGLEAKALPPYPSDLVIREDKTALSDAVRRFGRGPANSGDMAVRMNSSPEEPVSLGLAGVRGLGEPAVLLSLADSTEETRLKRQVAQASKMQAVGQLAGGVAHDFNNVLTAIIGYCDLMLMRHTPGDSDYDDIQQIKANSNRAASLTRQLLAFSRQQTLRPEVLQLPDVVSEVSQLLKRLLGAKITLDVHHDRGLGAVRADPRQLEQVIVNLAVNARDAIQMNGGGETAHGTLTLATRKIDAAEIRRSRSDIVPPADYTALIAEDTGGGIPPDVISKIFEPFFTTKETGKGTGLGLSTVYGIIKQSGGFIFVDNVGEASGRPTGARFTIYLPVHHGGDAPETPKEEKEERKWSGGGHILLVEDEDMVRAVAERALTRQGYQVTPASDGDEGLEIINTGRQFDLVVSDVVMPAMDGPAMVREIRKLRPELPVLFMSGYAEEQLRKEIDIADMHFIPKPFSVTQIADKVGEVLAGARK